MRKGGWADIFSKPPCSKTPLHIVNKTSMMGKFDLMWSKTQLASVIFAGALLAGCGSSETEETPSSSVASSTSSAAVSSPVVSSSSSVSSVTSSSSSVPVVEVEPQDYDHCVDGFRPHETDGSISTEGWVHEQGGEQDVAVDPIVFNYMYENGWQDAHVLWHQARTCSSLGGFGSASINGLPSACDFPELLPTQNDCEGDENGLDFLAGHSIMMYQLRELWPSHLPSFSGWESFPRNKEDFPAPIQDRFKGWSAEILAAADIGDNIEDNIDMFPNEGALGTWISCAIMPGASETIGGSTGGFGGFGNGADFSINRNLHFALHDQAAPPNNTKHSVNNTNNNLDSFMFWKLHSWIDHVWLRYRAAKNIPNSEQIFEDVMVEQCREMDAWREISVEARGEAGHPNNQDNEEPYVEIAEGGFFHENVRPAFERVCTQCHGQGGEAGLQLGSQISSTEIVEQLINRESNHAADQLMVVPGAPEQSWLYLKATGESANINPTCIVTGCESPMPGLTDEELENLRQWIADGAPLPIIL